MYKPRAFCIAVLLVLAAPDYSAAAGKVSYEIHDSSSRFESTEAARQAGVDAAAQLVEIAQQRFGITLDGSELSVIELQKLAEQVRIEYRAVADTSEQERQLTEWVRLFSGYYGELLVKHHGAVWGKTDWMGGDERALGFPASKGILLPVHQITTAFANAGSLCRWYIIATSDSKHADVPAAITECYERGWKQSPAGKARAAEIAAYLKKLDEDDLKQRATTRTVREVKLIVGRENGRAVAAFQAHKIRPPAKLSFGFTVAPQGNVVEAHKIKSDFDNPALEQVLLDLVRGMKFEARDVPEYVSPGLVFSFAE